MDNVQRYAEARRSGLNKSDIPLSGTPLSSTPPEGKGSWSLALNVVAIILALAFSAYAVWLAGQKSPRDVVNNQLQQAQDWAISQLHQDTMQQYVIDKFFATTPKTGQKLTMLVCNKEGCEIFKSPAKLSPVIKRQN